MGLCGTSACVCMKSLLKRRERTANISLLIIGTILKYSVSIFTEKSVCLTTFIQWRLKVKLVSLHIKPSNQDIFHHIQCSTAL